DSSVFFGVQPHQDTLFTWYAEGVDGPVMTMERGYYPLLSGYVSPLPLTVYRHDVSSGVNAVSEQERLRVHPCPLRDRAWVELPDADWIGATLDLYDAHGARVRRDRVSAQRQAIEREGLPAGLYVLNAQHRDGRRQVARLVVE
ncbi:MAG TPA: hypothetical protein VHL57_11310, partial [Flavobacteriales bacterium]|nr:hypothetical protein [Flavobacteriales bacterium]